MKNVFLLILCVLFVTACNPIKTEKKKVIVAKDSVSTKKDTLNTQIQISEDLEEPSGAVFNNNLITLTKTPCSGECPIFEIEISKDSILTYKGIEGVSIIGERELKLNSKQFASIMKAIQNSDFESLEESYENSNAVDFSKTIITYNEKDITIRLWKDAPKKLTALYVVIEDILYDNKFLE